MTIFSRKNHPSDYYVYAYLREDGSPYYIGKGSAGRAWIKHNEGVNPPKDLTKIIILEHKLSDVGALAIERRMIRWYGRKDLETGILRNKSDGGDGPAGRRVTHLEKEQKRKQMKQWWDENSQEKEKRRETCVFTDPFVVKKRIDSVTGDNSWLRSEEGRQWAREEYLKKGNFGKSGSDHHCYDHNLYVFINIDTNVVEQLTRQQLKNKYNLTKSGVKYLMKGNGKTHRSWKLSRN